MIFISATKNGEQIEYRDEKRFLWILSVLTPIVPGIGALAYLSTGSLAWGFLAPVIYYAVIPLLDTLIGTDPHNPPEEVVEQMAEDQWYRRLLFLSIPVYFASMILSAMAAAQTATPWWAVVLFALGAGTTSGTALTVGHELGHKPNFADQWGAKLINALSGYAHFCIEHNRGHHILVATPEDPASSRYGESLYQFALRELPGAALRGWDLEKSRMKKKGHSFWHWRNDLLQGYAIHMVIVIAMIVLFGWVTVPFFIIHNVFAWFHLTMANYVEHYGLKRKTLESGRLEPCEPRHSWNTNHRVSNLLLFHLQRHSDHHSNPLRPYQALRDFEDLPELPSGYPGSFLLASVPPLWFHIMNPKVLEWADGDMDNINVQPS